MRPIVFYLGVDYPGYGLCGAGGGGAGPST